MHAYILFSKLVTACPTSSDQNRLGDLLPSDREYLCLGEWEEDGLLYTYTRRTHNPRHECFVGRVTFHHLHSHLITPQVENGGRILLAEGGPNCRRGLRVDMFGMELSKRGR